MILNFQVNRDQRSFVLAPNFPATGIVSIIHQTKKSPEPMGEQTHPSLRAPASGFMCLSETRRPVTNTLLITMADTDHLRVLPLLGYSEVASTRRAMSTDDYQRLVLKPR